MRVVNFRRNYGQTPAMAAGIEHARGEILVTMDGDLQNDPADIGLFLEKIDEGYDIVVGWRHNRQDKLVSRKIPSRIANRLIGKVTGVPITRQRLLAQGLPRLAHQEHPAVLGDAPLHPGHGLDRRPAHCRDQGSPSRAPVRQSKYGLSRVYKVLLDLMVIKTVASFTSRPLLWFALLSIPLVLLSTIAFGYTLVNLFGAEPSLSLPIAGSGVIFLTSALVMLCGGAIGELVYKLGDVREQQFSQAHEQGAHRRTQPSNRANSCPDKIQSTFALGHRPGRRAPRAAELALRRNTRRRSIALRLPYEFIFVLDGPRPKAAAELDRLLQQRASSITVVSLTRRFGEATALMAGFERTPRQHHRHACPPIIRSMRARSASWCTRSATPPTSPSRTAGRAPAAGSRKLRRRLFTASYRASPGCACAISAAARAP